MSIFYILPPVDGTKSYNYLEIFKQKNFKIMEHKTAQPQLFQLDISWVVPPPSNCGKWRFIGIPY